MTEFWPLRVVESLNNFSYLILVGLVPPRTSAVMVEYSGIFRRIKVSFSLHFHILFLDLLQSNARCFENY